MKANLVRWFQRFLLVGAVFQLLAQQSEPDSKLLADIRIKAEMGHALAQYSLGYFYERGQGVAKDETEAARWYRKASFAPATGGTDGAVRPAHRSQIGCTRFVGDEALRKLHQVLGEIHIHVPAY